MDIPFKATDQLIGVPGASGGDWEACRYVEVSRVEELCIDDGICQVSRKDHVYHRHKL